MEDYPKSVSKRRTKIIYDQMNDSFYKIKGKDNKFGIGIFCKVILNNKTIFFLMTNFHLIDNNYIENNSGIKIKINNELINLKFGDKRFKYINKEYDLSIIEIKENKIIKLNYLEIDESLYDKESTNISNKDSIYIIHHNNSKQNEISVSYGIIRYINNLKFTCSCNINASGTISPIFNLNNNKLIGIYINNSYQSKQFIKGIFLKNVINEFNELINLHKNIFEVKNEINILIKVFKEDINRKIYFLNKEYMKYKENNLIENNDNNLEYLNELNTELYINEKLVKYKKYFKPNNEGEYRIKLKFNFNLTDCSYMFADCENIIKIDFLFNSYFVKYMKKMFYKCVNLKEINLLTFDFTNVKDMSYMFSDCENLVSLDLSSFYNKIFCKNLCYLNLSNFSNNNTLNLECIFHNCKKLKNLNLFINDLKAFDNSKDYYFFHKIDILNSNVSKRNKELLLFLINKCNNNKNLSKINNKKLETYLPFLPFIINHNDISTNSNFILISNDILLVRKEIIFDDKGKSSLSFPQINEKLEFDENDFYIENDNNNKYSFIKVLYNNFYFEKYFKIPNDNFEKLGIETREKYFINEDNIEISLGINIDCNKYNIIKKLNHGSPIYIKTANQLFLIGIINKEKELSFFDNKELFEIKKKIDIIESKLKYYQIKKLSFNQKINDSDMNFIFQYDFVNLEYLNLENNSLTNEGLKMLQNKALRNIKYLNLSNNSIDDKGLTYLHCLSNLNELILFNMPNLSDDYFSSLQSNTFIDKLNVFKCDKKKLSLKYVNTNYNKFFLPNLNCLKLIFSNESNVGKELNVLFTLNNINSRIINLDLLDANLSDEDLSIFTKNISLFKKIKQIDLLNANFTSSSEKYLTELEKKKIKIIVKSIKVYNILLGGSTISGKTTYFEAYFTKKFNKGINSTIASAWKLIKKINKNEFYLNDCCRWGSVFDSIVKIHIRNADAVILLFDISDREDFKGLSILLNMIKEIYDLESFPVLLIGNKSDKDINVSDDEINELLEKEKLIGYFEVSCKTQKNVEESVNFMVNYINKKDKED